MSSLIIYTQPLGTGQSELVLENEQQNANSTENVRHDLIILGTYNIIVINYKSLGDWQLLYNKNNLKTSL